MNQYHSAPENLEEGEKPFWISYSDLMTALMILFLVVMVSTLSAVTKQTIPAVDGGMVPLLQEPELKSDIPKPEQSESSNPDKLERLRQAETMHLCKKLEAKSDQAGLGASINCETKTIDLGEGARFESGKWEPICYCKTLMWWVTGWIRFLGSLHKWCTHNFELLEREYFICLRRLQH